MNMKRIENGKEKDMVLYRCKENNNHFVIILKDGIPEEIYIGDSLEKEWTIIGFNDLKRGFEKTGFTINKKGLMI